MEWDKLSLDPSSKTIYELYLKEDKTTLVSLFQKTQNDLLKQIDTVRDMLRHAQKNS